MLQCAILFSMPGSHEDPLAPNRTDSLPDHEPTLREKLEKLCEGLLKAQEAIDAALNANRIQQTVAEMQMQTGEQCLRMLAE